MTTLSWMAQGALIVLALPVLLVLGLITLLLLIVAQLAACWQRWADRPQT